MKKLARTSIPALIVIFSAWVVVGASAAVPSAARMSIQVISPAGAVTVHPNGKIPIRVAVTGITLDVRAMGHKAVPGHGHYHFYVDCIPGNAYTAVNLGGCWAGATASTRVTFDLATSHVPITPGTHTLFLALARNDHILYQAPSASIIFNVVEPHYSIQVLAPTAPVTVSKNGKMAITVDVEGVHLAPNELGQQDVPGHGHYHFYVDCIPQHAYEKPELGTCWAGASTSERTTFSLAASKVRITPGTHILLLALAHNNHVLYRAPAASVVFTVTP